MTAPTRLRALLAEQGLVLMPAVWDGLTARLVSQAGFRTAFLSGACVTAGRLGGPDLDLVSFGEMLDSLHQAQAAAPELLILGDGDHGYGNAINVQRTVRAYGRAGAAAVLIEDKVTPHALDVGDKLVLPQAEARMKVRAAVEAAADSGIMVLARTNCRPTLGIDEAVARIEAFTQEGADILFLDSPADYEELRRAVAAAGERASFAILSPNPRHASPTRAEAAALGVKIGAYPFSLLAPAVSAMQAGLEALAEGDDTISGRLSASDVRTLLGYTDYESQARRFDPSREFEADR